MIQNYSFTTRNIKFAKLVLPFLLAFTLIPALSYGVFTNTSTMTPVSCNGVSDGTIVPSSTGGTAPITYTIGGGSIGLTYPAGSYTVLATDATTATATAVVVITQPAVLTSTTSSTPVSCFGLTDGTITVNPTGGNGGYTVTSSPPVNFAAAAKGTYAITIVDSKGCNTNTNVIVGGPTSAVVATITGSTNPSCVGYIDGTFSFTASGGTGPYTFATDGATFTATSPIIPTIPKGTYTITAKDNTGCKATSTVMLSDPPALVAPVLSFSTINCNGGNSTITASTTGLGGTPSYTYKLNAGSFQAGNTFSPYVASVTPYSVTLKDSKGCSITSTITITEPAVVVPTASTYTNVSCKGGSNGEIAFSAIGGSGTYTFTVNGVVSTSRKSGLVAGIYTIIATDGAGCSKTITTTVTEPALTLSVTASKTDVPDCKGYTTGSITINPASGGTLPYSTYSINGSGASVGPNNGYGAGTYTILAKDANSCPATTTVTITEPPLLVPNFTNSNVACFGDLSAVVTGGASGGTPGYTYSIGGSALAVSYGVNAGIPYTFTVTDSKGCVKTQTLAITQPPALSLSVTAPAILCFNNKTTITATAGGGTTAYSYTLNGGATQPANTFTNVAGSNAGIIYTVNVIDAHSCSLTQTITVTQPSSAVTVSAAAPAIACNTYTTTITATGGGGTGTIQYSIDGTTYVAGNTFAKGAGTYTLYAKDGNSCVGTTTLTLSEPTTLTVTPSVTTTVTCNGTSTGVLAANASGATPGYTYTWSPSGGNSATTTAIPANTYSVAVSDSKGCIKTGTITLTQPAVLTVSAIAPTILCATANSTTITASGVGGVSTYSFNLNNGAYQASNVFNSVTGTVSPGTIYTVGIKDASACSTTTTITVVAPSALTLTPTVTNVPCKGGTGTITAVATGGVSTYTYTGIGNPVAGTYTVKATDNNGCTITTSVIVSEPTATLTVTPTYTNVTCFGAANGIIAATPAGGTSGYTVTVAGSPLASTYGPGTYTVNVIDTHSCVATATVTISQPSTLTVTATNVDVKCAIANTTTITATGGGGTTTYSYTLNGGAVQTSNTFTGQPGSVAGITYTIAIKDANSCTNSTTIIVTAPSSLTITPTITNVPCKGGTGTITAIATGGTSTYTYTGIGNPVAGTYSVQATDSKGCTITTNVTLTEPLANLTVSTTFTNVTCFGAANGIIAATPAGGTSGYTVTVAGSPLGSTYGPGTYTVNVIDTHSCVATASVTITQPAGVIVVTPTVTQTVTCNGGTNGTFSVTASGGNVGGGYTYTVNDALAVSASRGAGTYTITATDNKGCFSTASVTITQPLALVAAPTYTTITCNGANNGIIVGGASGGVAPYVYTIGGAPIGVNYMPGNYTVLVKDANNCTNTAVVAMTQPAILVATPTYSNVICNGTSTGIIVGGATGGTSTYTYTVNGAPIAAGYPIGTYTFSVKDAHSCAAQTTITLTQPTIIPTVNVTNVTCYTLNNGTITGNATGGNSPYTYLINGAANAGAYAAGTYTVKVTDATTCTITTTVTITQPAQLMPALTKTDVKCFGTTSGTITGGATGGTAPYTYSLGGPLALNYAIGTYTILITDANNCATNGVVTVTQPAVLVATSTVSLNVACFNGTNGVITGSATGGTTPYTYTVGGNPLSTYGQGTYTVLVTDFNLCTATSTVTITQPSAALAVTSTFTNVTCNGFTNGIINASSTGGTPTYTFTVAGSPLGSTYAAGTYTVLSTDSHGCLATTSVTLTQPSTLVANPTYTNVLCNGGSTGIIVGGATGGTAGYTYLVNNSAIVAGYPIGTYTVQAMDTKSCVATTTVTLTQPATLVATPTYSHVTCNGTTTGIIVGGQTGGTSTYTYTVNGNPIAANYAAGTYTFQVKDANLCTATSIITITQPTALVASPTFTNVLCNGGSTGIIAGGASGGTPGYSYLVNGSAIAAGYPIGTYTVQAMDTKSCVATATVTITQPAVLVANPTYSHVTCFGTSTGLIVGGQTGGVSTYTYTVNGSPIAANYIFGTYTFQVKDANLCTASTTITLTQPAAALVATAVTTTTITCNLGANGAVSASAVGGTTAYTYSWTPSGGSGATASALTAGTYTVKVTDSKGCFATSTTIVSQPAAISPNLVVTHVKCRGGSTGVITGGATTGGTSPYVYTIGGSPLGAAYPIGTYTILVVDANLCTTNAIVTLTQPASLPTVTATAPSVLCKGGSVAITPVGVGGTTPYTYQVNGVALAGTYTANTYTVQATDFNGCTTTTIVTFTEPTVALSVTATYTNIACIGGITSIVPVGAGGTGTTYTYTVNGSVPAASYLAGTYTVQAKDINSCTASTILTITAPSTVTVTATSAPFILCKGNTTTINPVGSGGTGSTYTFQVNGVAIANPYPAGTYTVKAIDINGCNKTTTLVVTEPTLSLTVVASNTGILCTNGTASINAAANGGTGAYTYALNGGAGQAAYTFANQNSGNYTVQVTDGNLCVSTYTMSIANPATLTVNATNIPILCNGGNSNITTSSTGGTGTKSYNINGGLYQASTSFSRPMGIYTIQAKDGNGCLSTMNLSITEPPLIVITPTATAISCNNGTTSIVATTIGGTGTLSYQLNAGTPQASNTFTNVSNGTYTLTVKDANNCPKTQTITITNPTVVSVTANSLGIMCKDSSATINAVGLGGTGTLSYSLNGGALQTATAFTNKLVGTYTVVAQDTKSCVATTTITLTQPATNVSVNATNSIISCNGGNSTITVTGAGGTGAKVYNLNGGLNQASGSFSGNSANIYTVGATDANNCFVTTTINVTQPSVVSVTLTSTPVLCNAGSSTITATAMGGANTTYSYSLNGGATQASNIFSKKQGTYTITAYDVNGCFGQAVITITEPPLLTLSITSTAIICNGGTFSITASAGGGVTPYMYSENGGTLQSSNIFEQTAGSYTIAVSDFNGCIKTVGILKGQPALFVFNSSSTAIPCNGGTGTITATGAAINYSLNGGAPQTSGTFTNVSAGTYTVMGTSASGCTRQSVITLVNPPVIVFNATATNATCNGANGTITFTASGGSGAKIVTVNGITATSPYSIGAGTYTVIATDIHNCFVQTILTISEPNPIVLTASGTDAICNSGNGSIAFTASGGTGSIVVDVSGTTATSPYSVPAGTYVVKATDANSCSVTTEVIIAEPAAINLVASANDANCYNENGSLNFSATGGTYNAFDYLVNGTAQTDPYLTNAGTYTVEAKDADNCRSTAVLVINQPTAISITTSSTTPKCVGGMDGTITFSATGGTGNLYLDVLGNASPYTTASAGVYTINASDDNGCVTTSTITVSDPTPIVITVSSTTPRCINGSNGTLTFTASGGTSGTYTFNVNSTPQTSPYTNANMGTYTINATDAYGCSTTSTITVSDPTPIVISTSTTMPLCNGGSDGSITFSASGGTSGTYTFNVNGTSQTSPYTTASAGNYTIQAIDGNSCVKNTVTTVSEPTAVALTITVTNAVCVGSNGALEFSATGGTGTIAYNVNGMPQVSPYLTPVGTYTVGAIDANNCAVTSIATISHGAVVPVTASVVSTSVCTGTLDSIYAGGASTYAWSGPGGFTSSNQGQSFAVNALQIGTYTVVGTDLLGCTATSTVDIVSVSNSGNLAQASTTNISSVPGTTCTTLTQPDGSNVNYYNTNCDLIATVKDASGSNVLGNVTACVNVLSTIQTVNGQPYVPRVYDIHPTSQGPADITLYYTNDDILNYNAGAGSFPTLGTGAPESGLTNGQTMTVCITKVSATGGTIVYTEPATWNAAGHYWQVTVSVPSFSTLFCHACNPNMAALSLDLVDFKGRKNGTTDVLSWATENEKDMKGFQLLRSTNGTDYSPIGNYINSKAPNGNSTSKLDYTYTDEQPVNGNNYYKLQMFDNSNHTQYSNVVKLAWGSETTVSVYPNPATDELSIDIAIDKATHASIKVFDATGKTVKIVEVELEKGMNTAKVDLTELAAGAYLIKVSNGKGLDYSQQFKKQ